MAHGAPAARTTFRVARPSFGLAGGRHCGKLLEVPHLLGREIARLPPAEQDAWTALALRYWRRRGFPFPEVTPSTVEHDFRCLEAVQPSQVVAGSTIRCSTVGLRTANAFHPQMWRVKIHGASPVELFNDDVVLRRALAKAVRFWPGRRCWNAQCVRGVMRIYRRTRVGNFRPTAAKALIELLSDDRARVLDFSAGYGGRLLGL